MSVTVGKTLFENTEMGKVAIKMAVGIAIKNMKSAMDNAA